MSLLRKVGRWSLAGLVINSVIGSSIFGLPSELTPAAQVGQHSRGAHGRTGDGDRDGVLRRGGVAVRRAGRTLRRM